MSAPLAARRLAIRGPPPSARAGERAAGDASRAIEEAAVAAKAYWIADDEGPGPLFQAVLDAYRAGSTWGDSGAPTSDVTCRAAAAELVTAGFVSIDLTKCWKDNPGVVEQTGRALGDAQASTARVLAALSLPPR